MHRCSAPFLLILPTAWTGALSPAIKVCGFRLPFMGDLQLPATLVTYNTHRPHQGRGMNGRTPADVFARCLRKTKKPKEDKMGKAA